MTPPALYLLDPAAINDLREVARYTYETWGSSQTKAYKENLKKCMRALAKGEGFYKDLSPIYPGLRSVLCQHHYIFGLVRKNQPAVILAVLHERMDMLARLKTRL